MRSVTSILLLASVDQAQGQSPISGQWTSSYVEGGHTGHSFYDLQFAPDGTVTGTGNDDDGQFQIQRGVFYKKTGEVVWRESGDGWFADISVYANHPDTLTGTYRANNGVSNKLTITLQSQAEPTEDDDLGDSGQPKEPAVEPKDWEFLRFNMLKEAEKEATNETSQDFAIGSKDWDMLLAERLGLQYEDLNTSALSKGLLEEIRQEILKENPHWSLLEGLRKEILKENTAWETLKEMPNSWRDWVSHESIFNDSDFIVAVWWQEIPGVLRERWWSNDLDLPLWSGGEDPIEQILHPEHETAKKQLPLNVDHQICVRQILSYTHSSDGHCRNVTSRLKVQDHALYHVTQFLTNPLPHEDPEEAKRKNHDFVDNSTQVPVRLSFYPKKTDEEAPKPMTTSESTRQMYVEYVGESNNDYKASQRKQTNFTVVEHHGSLVEYLERMQKSEINEALKRRRADFTVLKLRENFVEQYVIPGLFAVASSMLALMCVKKPHRSSKHTLMGTQAQFATKHYQ